MSISSTKDQKNKKTRPTCLVYPELVEGSETEGTKAGIKPNLAPGHNRGLVAVKPRTTNYQSKMSLDALGALGALGTIKLSNLSFVAFLSSEAQS